MPELVIDRVNIIDYRMPLKRPYGTARGVTRSSKNFLIRLFADHEGSPVVGIGEAQPRHRLTGDVSVDLAWVFLQEAAEKLRDRSLELNGPAEALDSVRAVMADLADLAQEKADERNEKKPYRGTLLGIEVALLDLVSRALNLPLSEVLGQERDSVTITVSTLSTQNSAEQFRKKVEKQGRYPMVRVKGIGDFDEDSSLLELVHSANQAAGRSKPIWMDLNEGFDEPGAVEFLKYVAEAIRDGRLPEIISLEQPIPGRHGERLPELQRVADELTADSGIGEIRIMPDESLWDIGDLETVHSDGGCRAMNIKTAKAGGLLASLDLARRAVELNPETNLCIGGMVGTSDITTWSLLSLAKALPRVDYITAVPPGNVKQRISHPLARFESRESSVLANSDQPGIGAELDVEAVQPFIHRQAWYPGGAATEDDAIGAERKVLLAPASDGKVTPEHTYRVLFLGDFHYGESYATGGGTVLPERGYGDGTKYLEPFREQADVTVANLETPVVSPETVDSPWEGKKRFLHWADPVQTPQALKELGVDAVSLANNHTLDYGRDGLQSSLKALKETGVRVFGAGKDLAAARKPLRLKLPSEHGGGSVFVHGSMLAPQKPNQVLDPFATESESGCAPVGQRGAGTPGNEQGAPNIHIAFPHWGPNYKWRTARQELIGKRLVRAGFDLVIGHGAHCLQEIGRYDGTWLAYGIGNGHFQARGRYDSFVAKNGILPFSFWVMVTVDTLPGGARRVYARFYPVSSDNRRTDFQPHPVGEEDFHRIVQELYRREGDGKLFDSGEISGGHDELGRYLQVEVGAMQTPIRSSEEPLIKRAKKQAKQIPHTARAVRGLRRRVESGGEPSPHRSADTPARNPVEDLPVGEAESTSEDRLLQLVKSGRTLGTQLIADRAAEDGVQARWFGGATCVLSWGDQRVLLQGNRSVESSVGAGVIKDKYVTKTFLQKGEARAPEGYLAASADEAVEILERLGRPVVVKPRAGDRGRAVTVNVRDEPQARKAFARAEEDASGGVLVEEYILGEEYRCLVTQDECMSVVKRAQANVRGDGESTIAQLIDQKNRVRRENPYLHKKLIVVDDDAVRYLQDQGLTLQNVPATGEQILVRPVGNFSHGADVVECSDAVGADLKDTALAAVRSIPGMSWAGIDVVVSNETGLGYVLEVNSNSGIGSHHFPLTGEAKNIADRIWQERRAIAAPAVTSLPSWPEPQETPWSVEPGTVRLADLLRSVAKEELGFTIENLGGGTYELSRAGEPVEWLRGCTTTKDLSAVGSVLSRHGTVRRILESEGIPITSGRRIRTEDELIRFAQGAGRLVRATGYLRPWDGVNRQVFTAEDLSGAGRLLRKSGSLIAQDLPDGSRFAVVASPTQVLLVVGDSAVQPPSVEELGKASELAVRAVRAIPELRWAVVDVVVPDPESGQGALVEGLSSNPALEGTPVVLAGSSREFAEALLNT